MRALQDATTAANTAAILAGAHILRVHDVGTARDAAALADRILAAVAISTQPPKPLS
jgi:dihydropteroate synthase